MSKIQRGLIVAAALGLCATAPAYAGDGGDGGDSGDNGMNPMYGDSFAATEGQGQNVGHPRIEPSGAYAAHEMDGQTTPLLEQMRQTQARMAAQTRAMMDRTRSALHLPGSTSTATTQ